MAALAPLRRAQQRHGPHGPAWPAWPSYAPAWPARRSICIKHPLSSILSSSTLYIRYPDASIWIPSNSDASPLEHPITTKGSSFLWTLVRSEREASLRVSHRRCGRIRRTENKSIQDNVINLLSVSAVSRLLFADCLPAFCTTRPQPHLRPWSGRRPASPKPEVGR